MVSAEFGPMVGADEILRSTIQDVVIEFSPSEVLHREFVASSFTTFDVPSKIVGFRPLYDMLFIEKQLA